MLKRTIGIAVASMTMMAVYAQKNIPLVYGEENTGKNFKAPAMPGYNDLRECRTLTNPFEWSNGKGKVKKFKQWERRRNEIAAESGISSLFISRNPALWYWCEADR